MKKSTLVVLAAMMMVIGLVAGNDSAGFPGVLAAEVVIGPEFEMDQPVFAPGTAQPNDQYLPAIAFNGEMFLVAWLDNRNHSGREDIYAARVSSSGVVLDPNGVAVSVGVNSERRSLSLASDGDGFLVLWQDARNGVRNGFDIYGARVTRDGLVREKEGFLVCGVEGDQVAPRVAFNGLAYFAVWEDRRGAVTRVFGTLLLGDATVLEPDGLALAASPGPQIFPSVASNGRDWLVAWQDGRDVEVQGWDLYAARFDAKGLALDAESFPVSAQSGHQGLPAIASDGRDYFIVWEDWRDLATTGRHVYGALVAGDLRRRPREILVARHVREQTAPTVAFRGGAYLAAWQDARNAAGPSGSSDIFGRRISPGGDFPDEADFPVHSDAANDYYPALVPGGPGTWLMVNQRNHDGISRIIGAFIHCESRPFPLTISRSADSVTLGWNAEAGRTYRVQFTDSLSPPGWSDLPGEVVAGGDGALQVRLLNDSVQTPRFYRVVQLTELSLP